MELISLIDALTEPLCILRSIVILEPNRDLGWPIKTRSRHGKLASFRVRKSHKEELYVRGATVRGDARFGCYHKINRSIRPSNLSR